MMPSNNNPPTMEHTMMMVFLLAWPVWDEPYLPGLEFLSAFSSEGV
jgi:hypothetical protein